MLLGLQAEMLVTRSTAVAHSKKREAGTPLICCMPKLAHLQQRGARRFEIQLWQGRRHNRTNQHHSDHSVSYPADEEYFV